MLRTILAEVNITCFADIYQKLKELENAENSLITDIPRSLQVVNRFNPATFCTPEEYFSTTRRLEIWLRLRVTKSDYFNSLGLLNTHKELKDKLDLVRVGNEFISLNEERF